MSRTPQHAVEPAARVSGKMIDAAMQKGPAVADQISPYDLLPGIEANSSRSQIQQYLHDLQRQGLTRLQRDAIRTLMKPPRRAVWDLFELGTTPEVGDSTWAIISRFGGNSGSDGGEPVTTESAVADVCDKESERFASTIWCERIRRDGVDWNAVHVCALVALHQSRRQIARGDAGVVDAAGSPTGTASKDSQKACVAFWAALLSRRRWLTAFQRHRYRIWDWNPRQPTEPDEFLKLVEGVALLLLLPLAGNSPDRRLWLQSLWNQETAALAAQRAAGISDRWPHWTAGFGPLGLTLLNEQANVLNWLIRNSRGFPGGTPVSSLKSGTVRLTTSRHESMAEAATAIHWLFSELGPAAAEIWHGRGRFAEEELRALRNRYVNETNSGDDPSWFGDHQQGAALRERALEELAVEVRLALFHDEISRPGIAVSDVREEAVRIFDLASRQRSPWSVICQLEVVVAGRVRGCLNDRPQLLTRDVDAVIKVALQLVEKFSSRDGGQKLAAALATLCAARAEQAFCRWTFDTPERIQVRIRTDLMNAIDLAPLDPDIVEMFGTLIQTLTFMAPSEHRDLLRFAHQKVQNCLAQGITSIGLKKLLNDLQE